MLTATPANSTCELIPSVSQALCFCTPYGLHRAQFSLHNPAYAAERGRSTPQLAQEVSLVTSRESGYQLLNQPACAGGSRSKWVLETSLPFLGNSHTAESRISNSQSQRSSSKTQRVTSVPTWMRFMQTNQRKLRCRESCWRYSARVILFSWGTESFSMYSLKKKEG